MSKPSKKTRARARRKAAKAAKRARHPVSPDASATPLSSWFLDAPDAEIVEPTSGPVPASRSGFTADPALLERSRAHWELGDWDQLSALAALPLADHPDRAKLALLAGVGLAQTGDIAGARTHVRRAQEWGCPHELVARLMVAGVYNSLGRAASLHADDDRALRHFETSVATVSPQADARALGQARNIHEKARLGQLPQAAALIRDGVALISSAPGQRDLAALQTRLTALEATARTSHTEIPALVFAPATRDSLAAAHTASDQAGRLPRLIETKSLPRAGLHFAKSFFAALGSEAFAFCERYQEPGCCGQSPCALADPALPGLRAGKRMVRMTKSHDFDLSDPNFAPPAGCLRLIMIRDPLMVLTSWWVLVEIRRHTDVLRTHGIQPEKLYYQHEKDILAATYAVMEAHYHPVPPGMLTGWLDEKVDYMCGFADKWLAEPDRTGQRVVHYDDIPAVFSGLLDGWADDPLVSTPQLLAARDRLDTFSPRQIPGRAPVSQIEDFLQIRAADFADARARILAHSSAAGRLASYLKN